MCLMFSIKVNLRSCGQRSRSGDLSFGFVSIFDSSGQSRYAISVSAILVWTVVI